jgi:hypothetical protein
MERNIEKESFSPPHCIELLRRFEKKEVCPIGEKLRFSGVGKNDVYNISRPFPMGDATVITGRVEAREARADSHVMFFENQNDVWVPASGAPILPLEDGFATHIGDETIIGGVEVYPSPTGTDPRGIGYRTDFYRGRDLSSFQKFASGPDGMKDIRLASLTNSRIGVFTRPQGGSGGKGKIGYVELQRLEDLENAQNLLNARIIEDQFAPEEWGGANELHPLPDGRIGIIGHVAYQDEQGAKHYYAMSFVYDPKMHRASGVEIIATRKNFPAGDAKTAKLKDVVFPGGLVRHGDGTATLYAGLSDAESGRLKLPDPFMEKGV